MSQKIYLTFANETKEKVYIRIKEHVLDGYRIAFPAMGTETFKIVILEKTHKESGDIYTSSRYYYEAKRDELKKKRLEKEGYIDILEEPYDDDTNMYVMVLERELYI